MTVEIGFTEELTNSQYAPLGGFECILPTESLARTADPKWKFLCGSGIFLRQTS